MVAIKKVTSRCKQCLFGFKQLTVSNFPSKVSPEHLDGIEPEAKIGAKCAKLT